MANEPYVCNLSPEVMKVAKEQLNEDDGRRASDIEALRVWLKKQRHLNCRTDDKFLLTFLRGCKFSLERTKEKIDMHLAIKSALPEFYADWDPANKEIEKILDLGISLPLPGYDDLGRRVILHRAGAFDATTVDPLILNKAMMMMGEVYLAEDEQAMICGYVFISDAAGATLAHLTSTPPSLMKKVMKCFEDGSPIRPKQIHQVNIPAFAVSFLTTMMQFMKEKIRQRMKIHPDYESLYKEVPQRLLPKEYGGENMSIPELTQYWKKKVMEKREYLMEQEKFKSDETKRPGKPRNSEFLFGIAGTEGSFRQLNID